jgi:hypothetical protein
MKVLYTDLIYKIFSSAVKNVVHNFTETNSLDMGYIFVCHLAAFALTR